MILLKHNEKRFKLYTKTTTEYNNKLTPTPYQKSLFFLDY